MHKNIRERMREWLVNKLTENEKNNVHKNQHFCKGFPYLLATKDCGNILEPVTMYEGCLYSSNSGYPLATRINRITFPNA